jgi:acylphosphatase
MKKRLHVFLSGRVQGVFYRDSARQRARELELTGWVRNLMDGRVELVAEGNRELLERLLHWCREGPTFARVADAEVHWEDYLAEFVDFEVRR